LRYRMSPFSGDTRTLTPPHLVFVLWVSLIEKCFLFSSFSPRHPHLLAHDGDSFFPFPDKFRPYFFSCYFGYTVGTFPLFTNKVDGTPSSGVPISEEDLPLLYLPFSPSSVPHSEALLFPLFPLFAIGIEDITKVPPPFDPQIFLPLRCQKPPTGPLAGATLSWSRLFSLSFLNTWPPPYVFLFPLDFLFGLSCMQSFNFPACFLFNPNKTHFFYPGNVFVYPTTDPCFSFLFFHGPVLHFFDSSF